MTEGRDKSLLLSPANSQAMNVIKCLSQVFSFIMYSNLQRAVCTGRRYDQINILLYVFQWRICGADPV